MIQMVLLVLILAGVIGLYFFGWWAYKTSEGFASSMTYGGPYEGWQMMCNADRECMCRKKAAIAACCAKQCKGLGSVCSEECTPILDPCNPNAGK